MMNRRKYERWIIWKMESHLAGTTCYWYLRLSMKERWFSWILVWTFWHVFFIILSFRNHGVNFEVSSAIVSCNYIMKLHCVKLRVKTVFLCLIVNTLSWEIFHTRILNISSAFSNHSSTDTSELNPHTEKKRKREYNSFTKTFIYVVNINEIAQNIICWREISLFARIITLEN